MKPWPYLPQSLFNLLEINTRVLNLVFKVFDSILYLNYA